MSSTGLARFPLTKIIFSATAWLSLLRRGTNVLPQADQLRSAEQLEACRESCTLLACLLPLRFRLRLRIIIIIAATGFVRLAGFEVISH